jgi:hypothetical protein
MNNSLAMKTKLENEMSKKIASFESRTAVSGLFFDWLIQFC